MNLSNRNISEEILNKHGYKSIVIMRETTPSLVSKKPMSCSFDGTKPENKLMEPVLIVKKLDGTEMKIKGDFAINVFMATLI